MYKTFIRKNYIIFLFLFSAYLAGGQDVNQYEQNGLFQHFKKFSSGSDARLKAGGGTDSPQAVEDFVKANFKANADYGIKVLNEQTDHLGIRHYRLQQTFNGFPIVNSMMVVHVKGGQVTAANGEWFKEMPAAKSASLSQEEGLRRALQKVNARKYVWETQEAALVREGKAEGDEHTDYYKPTGELVYISTGNALDAKKLTLSYKYDISAVEPVSKQLVYIDASTGNVVFVEDQIHDANVPGTANTGYYGAKPVTLDQVGSTYYTRQTGNRNIELIDRSRNAVISSTSSTISGTGNAKYYSDAYWGAEITIDFYKLKFNRNSYDGRGSKLTLHVNDASVANNAYWNGNYATFGNSSQGTPFTSLDVVAHEITHGVTGTSARLIYQNESGALNEGFSDIFGSYADFYAGVGQQWIMGEFIAFKRSMSNPNQYRQPDTYRGTYWASGSGDNGGVHTNSGVINYWFYLVCQGGNGTNDIGNAFTVSGIGVEKAAQVAYRALTVYLTSSSNYSAARTAVINSARDLYGAGSCEEAAVTNAMHAVGVGAKFNGNCNSGNTCDAITGLTATQLTATSATITWNAVAGISAYTLEYKPATSSNYTVITANSNSSTLTGLTPSTQYNVRVKYTCSNGVTADYTSTTFTTPAVPVCNLLTGLSVSSITSSSALVSWNAVTGISSYTVEYKLASSNIYSIVTANTNSINLIGLVSDTLYDVRVKYTCSNGIVADYVTTAFRTQGAASVCNVLTGLAVTSITSTSAHVSWNGVSGISSYTVEYKTSASSAYTVMTASSNSISLTGLSSGTLYDVRVKYTCTNGNTSGYASTTFTTDAISVCNALTGLSVSSVTSSSALVSWNAVAGITSYTVEYKTSASSTYTIVTASANSISLTGLTAGTLYNVRVKYTCSNGIVSDYVSANFTTQPATPVCNAPAGVSSRNITNTTAIVSWNAVSGVTSYIIEIRAAGETNYTPFTINGTAVSFSGLTANTVYEVRISYTCNGQTSGYGSTTFQTTGGSGGCSGIAPYQSGKIYMQGERMTYQGYIWEAATNYVYWTPQYGWWTNLGACTGSSAFGFAPEELTSTADLYPNPAKDRVTVRVSNNDNAKKDNIVLMNQLGSIVYQQPVELVNGDNTIELLLDNVQPGIYTLKVNGISKKIVISE